MDRGVHLDFDRVVAVISVKVFGGRDKAIGTLWHWNSPKRKQ
jgi:hypothetical protein